VYKCQQTTVVLRKNTMQVNFSGKNLRFFLSANIYILFVSVGSLKNVSVFIRVRKKMWISANIYPQIYIRTPLILAYFLDLTTWFKNLP